jgi:hypothetical protein
MSQFSDDRLVAAMTTITIFLPTAILNQLPFLIRKSEKLRRASEVDRVTGYAATRALARAHTNQ